MNKHRVTTSVFLLILSFLLAACFAGRDGGGAAPASVSTLDDSFWTLTSMAKTRPLPGSEITVGFIDGEMSGSSGCNTYFGAYQTAGEQIMLESVAFTEMACMTPEGVMEQEQRFLALLTQVDRFQRTSAELQLITPGGENLIFEPRLP